MKCPGCGAMASVASLEKGECSYCHAALQKPAANVPPPPPQVVHVTKVEIRGPDVQDLGEAAGHVVGSVTARVAGCFTGCLSTLVTLIIIGMVMGMVVFQTWATMPAPSVTSPPPPAPAPVHAPAPGGRKGAKRHQD